MSERSAPEATRNGTPIEFYFDLMSPYSYLGSFGIERVAARHSRVVDWRPVLIGVTVMKIMGAKPMLQIPVKGPYLYRDAPRVAQWLGVPFRHHGLKGINSLNAMRAFLWIKSSDPDLATAFAKRVQQRLWVRSEDITSTEAVVAEAAALGVDTHQLLQAIISPEGKQALVSAVDAAVARGVFGVPFYIADDQQFWGGDRLPMLDHWLTHHDWAQPTAR